MDVQDGIACVLCACMHATIYVICHNIYCFSKEKLPDVLIPPKLLKLERERALQWGKMLRQWEKFQGSDIVSVDIYYIKLKSHLFVYLSVCPHFLGGLILSHGCMDRHQTCSM